MIIFTDGFIFTHVNYLKLAQVISLISLISSALILSALMSTVYMGYQVGISPSVFMMRDCFVSNLQPVSL